MDEVTLREIAAQRESLLTAEQVRKKFDIAEPTKESQEEALVQETGLPDTAPAPERHECNCEYCEARPFSERIATVEVSLKDCQNPECPVGCPDSHAVYLGEDPPEAAKQPAPPVSAQWQPIETAPKDGTWILCAWKNRADNFGVPVVLYWHKSGCFTNIDPALSPVILNALQPTHWMPLPAPPDLERRK